MSTLFSLPDELLVMILNYCSSLDLIHVSRVCKKLNKLTCDRTMVKILNFQCQPLLQHNLLKSFLSLRPRAEHVITIDLTSCYWLTSSFIRDIVSRLIQVENVLVADTALNPIHLKQLLQSLSRVKRLSWTWQKGIIAEQIDESLQRLEFLYLCVPESKNLQSVQGWVIEMKALISWVDKCIKLRELWVISLCEWDYFSQPTVKNSTEFEHLERIFVYPNAERVQISSKAPLKNIWGGTPSILSLNQNQLLNIKYFYANDWREVTHAIQSGSTHIERLLCREPIGPNIADLLHALPELKSLHFVLPHSQEVAFMEMSGLIKLSIGICDQRQKCTTVLCKIASGCPKLKYLSLPVQSLVCSTIQDGTSHPSTSAASGEMNLCCSSAPKLSNLPSTSDGTTNQGWQSTRPHALPRISRVRDGPPLDVDTPFKRMIRETPSLEVFELGLVNDICCRPLMSPPLQWDFSSLTAISQWPHLTSLTLANIPIMHGKFFVKILKDCSQLKRLRLWDLGPQASCNYATDLYSGLRYCRTLEDFYWTQNYVGPTSQLWAKLQCISTLQRVALCLEGVSSIAEEEVYKTVESCPLLSFLHIATCSTKVKNKTLKQTIMARWSSTRPQLWVWFGTPGEYQQARGYPLIHAGEMFHNFSIVGADPLLGYKFLSFEKRSWAPHM